ncbi:Ephrin type-A receptor 10 [Rhizoctonia solani]|uniref:Ephrin type-A receptor 10 n=1 Tax=Rhizoctonia solani TaxID=456999 RepID=A0A0K6G191_9AGAM|nr:Ephrin type-A receptor 10 [Rhizoctonia solani]
MIIPPKLPTLDFLTGIRWKAPEIIEGLTGDTAEADIYALGMTILETLTGTLPYNEVPQDMVVLRNIIGGIHPARPEMCLPIANIQADNLWSLLLRCWAVYPLARPSAFDVRRQMREIALAPLPKLDQGIPLSDSQLLVSGASNIYNLEIPHLNTPDYSYVPYTAPPPSSRPSRTGSHSDAMYIASCHMQGLQNYKGVAQTQKSPVGAPTTIIHSKMTIGEILKHLTDHGCNDITHGLGDCQREYPVCTGGYGDVYRGTLTDGREVGLKCVRLLFDSSEKDQKKLKHTARELYVWSKCDHPNVMNLIGVAQFRGQLAMVSTWMDNGSMCEFLRRHPQTNRYLLCTQIIDGVIYLHDEKGIVHGDLKGANILISRDRIPKITDFGNSTLRECSLRFSVTASGPAVSVRWTAPEILEDKTGITTQADIYALGMTILEVITGEVPYYGVREMALFLKIIKPEYPKRPELHISSQNECGNLLWSLLLDCWSYEPKLRPTAASIQDRMKCIAGETDGPNLDILC